MSTNYRIKIILFALIALLSACVGTVEDKNALEAANKSTGDASDVISFDGLVSAQAISQDKIELYFRPADGDKATLTYEIYVNNGPVPIKVTASSLTLNANGLYVFTVTGLTMNMTYTFNMRAVVNGESSSLKLDPTKSISASTFKNPTADFLGISSLSLGAGESGRDTVTVKWVPATITGTNINPRDTDPVAYEITYVTKPVGAHNLNNANYAGTGRKVVTIPYPIGSPPALNRDNQYTVNGLTPGETYYFQVRAIHKGYITYKSDLSYKKEENTRYLAVTTLNNAGLFDFNEALVNMTNPLGEAGLTNLNISWIPAGGEFKQYRLCYKLVANPNDSAPITDYLIDTDIDALLSNTSACLPLDANLTSYTLTGLTSYAYYQAKVIACRTFDCDTTNRIKSSLLQKRVMANVAPFNGVLTIINPTDETKLKDIKVKFDSPVISAGFLNKFTLYCYSSSADTQPVAIPGDGSLSVGTGKPSCDGIQLLNPMPSSLADYGVLTNLEVRLPVIDGNARYCFSLLPSIQSAFVVQEDLTTAVIKCVTPEIKTPTIVQFPGRNNTCAINGKNLSINWPAPNGGLYTKFVILYREKQSGSNFFNFEDATTAFKNNNNLIYKWVDNLTRDTLDYTFTNLIQGRTYNIGVLPYLEDGAVKRFAQYNVNIGQCTLPLPTPTFTEWVDIFAIGPKEDGLTPPTNTGARTFILETLDNDGIPVDLKTTIVDPKAPDTVNDPLATQRLGSALFDGVYGSMNANDTNPLHQYSNSGIVKIGWKDVTFYNGSESLSSFISNPLYETTPGVKTQRKFGYKVYRSDDNQMSWVDLTKNSTANKFQTTANTGLLHPVDYSWRARNNASANVEKIVFFTDYSVKFSGSNDEIDRARVYFYKIIPIFDGKELDYGSVGNSTHHIIKVTLPPRNMALVHRMMANRTICLEMDKAIDTKIGAHYTCDYNGLGATGLTEPYAPGNTVYDQGGDLLIDRFELSCPFTRGDLNYVNSNSEFNLDKPDFKGFSTYNNAFMGCFNNDPISSYEPSTGSTSITSNYIYKKTIPGDCFGRDQVNKAVARVCSNPLYPDTRNYFYPGSAGRDDTNACGNPNAVGDTMFDLTNMSSPINTNNMYFPTQSEFAAVYYARSAYNLTSDWDYSLNQLPGGNSQKLMLKNRAHNGSCNINLNWVNSTGHYKPRWIPISGLFDRLKTVAAHPDSDGLDLYNKKMSEVLSHPSLYDATTVKAPTADLITSYRYKPTSTIARVATSNSAKLPPLDGLSAIDFNKLCSTYKIQVGLETSTKPFTLLDNKVYDKRMMRKKESTVASAWPQTYDSTKVTDIEQGVYTEGGIEKGCNSVTKLATAGTNSFSKNSFITTTFPHSASAHTALMTGNSSRDQNGNNANTEKCVSRFGVQDIVGNLKEYNSDQIFCDYNEDQLYLGVQGNPALSTRVGASSPIYSDTLTAWVLSTNNSGTCSIVESGASRTGNFVSNSLVSPIFNFLGNLDNSVIFKAKNYDQKSVLTARNGDGSFLDFGQDNQAPKLSYKDSIATYDPNTLDDNIIIPNYFNPALGMPLTCKAGCAEAADDNTQISSEQICSTKSCTNLTPTPVMMNFPTNNSRFTNVGTGDSSTGTERNSNNPNELDYSYAYEVNVAADPANNTLKYNDAVIGTSSPGVSYISRFSIARGSSLKMITGGSFKENSGRYSMHIYGYSVDTGSRDVYERSQFLSAGSRCAVLINQDE